MKTKKYPLNQCALYKCNSKRRLEKTLTIEQGQLKLIDSVIKYSHFEIDKKDSTEKRQITAPKYTLKQIQRRILRLIQFIERPEWVIAGTKEKSYIDNGEFHLKCNYALMVDIKKFYDNCKREYVYRFFRDKMLNSPDVAEILTDIVTYEGGVPTGCPTSQLIAYYAYEDMFANIKRIADNYGCLFSLYVDDMTFSSEKPFNKDVLKREIDIELRRYQHKPKYKKVKYYSKNDPKPITGTIVTKDNTLVAPNKLQEKVYKGFQDIKNLDIDDNSEETIKKIAALQGRIQASRNIEENKKFPEIERITKQISKEHARLNTIIQSKKSKRRPKKIRIAK